MAAYVYVCVCVGVCMLALRLPNQAGTIYVAASDNGCLLCVERSLSICRVCKEGKKRWKRIFALFAIYKRGESGKVGLCEVVK
jgi:hypothetical protein